MRGLVTQFVLAPLAVALGAATGARVDHPASGLLVGLCLGVLIAIACAFRSIRRLQRVSIISERGRDGQLPCNPPFDMRDEIDRAVYDAWRLASDSVRRAARDAEQIARQGLLIDRMQDGLMHVAADGSVLFANVTAGSMFGGRNPTGRSFIRVTRDHELNHALMRCLATGEDQDITLEVPADRRLISAFISRLPTVQPEALVVFRDITEVSRLQNLRRDFVANVSHELRTPLSTIKILTETLIDLRDDDPDSKPFLTKINNEVDQMTALVRDLLDLARLENQTGIVSAKPIVVRQLIADVRDRSNSLADRQGVALRVDVADDELMLIGDERRLHQALLNLVRNAIDHSQSGGEVTLGALREVGEVVLTVRDEGDGIAPDDLPRVWERFFKTDRARQGGGTGLGLAIVRNIVQAHGGTVEASSEVGKGSEFVLRIPGSMVESQANLLSSSTSAVNQRERSGNRDWFP